MKPFAVSNRRAPNCPGGLLLALTALFLVPREAPGLISIGDDRPVRDLGWPTGVTELANLESRDSWWEGPPFGGGEYHFNYAGDANAFADALAKFLDIRAPKFEIHIQPGACDHGFGREKGDDGWTPDVDWEFIVWRPDNWNRLHNNPEMVFFSDAPGFRESVPAPRLLIYLGHEGALQLEELELPKSKGRLEIIDHRASSMGIETEGAAIRASAYDAQSGKILEEARLTLQPRNAENDLEPITLSMGDSGLIEKDDTPPGDYTVSISAPGYASRTLAYPKMNANEYFDFTAYLEKTTRLVGKALDSEGAPIPNVEVSAASLIGSDGRGYSTPNSLEATTNEAGNFEISGVPMGYLVFRTHHPDYTSTPSIQNPVATSSEKVYTLRMAQSGELRVLIRDESGQPMSQLDGKSLIINIEPKGGSVRGAWGGRATVNRMGEYLFKNVPPADYVITSRPNPGRSDHEYGAPVEIRTAPGTTTEAVFNYKND